MVNEFDVFSSKKIYKSDLNIQFSSKLGNKCGQCYKLFMNRLLWSWSVHVSHVHLCLMSRIQTCINSSFLARELAFICISVNLSFQNNSYTTTVYLETTLPIEKDVFSQLTALRPHTCVYMRACVFHARTLSAYFNTRVDISSF